MQSRYKETILEAFAATNPLINDSSADFDAVDELNTLISSLTSQCEDEFTLIADVFPPEKVVTVMEQLVDKMIHDKNIGLETRVYAILKPSQVQTMSGLVE